MNTTTSNTQPPPQVLLDAMERLRAADPAGALELVEAALPDAVDRLPLLALAGVAALRAGEPARAIPHLRALLTARPNDKASQFNLANALTETGQFDEALEHARKGTGPQFARVEGFIHQQRGDTQAALSAYRRATHDDPADAVSWNNLANVLLELGQLDEAIGAYERAIAVSPRAVDLLCNLAEVLRRTDRGEARLATMRKAERIAPDDRRVLTELALAQAHVEDLDGAIETLERVVAQHKDFGESHIELGRLYEALNRLDDLAAFVDTLDLDTAPPEAAFLGAWLALRENRLDDAARFAEAIPQTINPMRRFQLVGQIADRRGDTASAFDAFDRMNQAAVADSLPTDERSYREMLEDRLAGLTSSEAGSWQQFRPADGRRDPIFLVGFPRSGTTLLDTMLMGLPSLSVLEERPMVTFLAQSIGDEKLSTLSATRIAELRNEYFRIARRYGWDDSRWLVDKHPLNMVNAPLIHLLFPRARFILAERHPYDVVLSTFMANFTMNYAMRSFTTLDEAARTYDAVFSMWQRSRELLNIDVHEVRYERLVQDAQAELEPLVRWLDLPWSDQILAHQETAKTRGRVRTASYSQISESLYTRALNRWRRYTTQLEPAKPILRPWAERMNYETE